VAEAVEEARAYVISGFRVLKVKLGHDVEEDVERLARIREAVGPQVGLRTDPNAGYDGARLARYLDGTRTLGLEFCEQPLPRGGERALDAFAGEDRARFAADESLHDLADAAALAERPRPYGIFNVKLMKCGGISPAQRIAHLCEGAGIDLMWGCNDESRVAIAAALHVAFAARSTRYLDLDGSLDLARDAVEGGFVLEDGLMRTASGPGLGVRWLAG
jgi:L-alanine-DL-glutamate epimerase-like enolase superfamily enzyme